MKSAKSQKSIYEKTKTAATKFAKHSSSCLTSRVSRAWQRSKFEPPVTQKIPPGSSRSTTTSSVSRDWKTHHQFQNSNPVLFEETDDGWKLPRPCLQPRQPSYNTVESSGSSDGYEESAVDRLASEYIRKVHERNRRDAIEMFLDHRPHGYVFPPSPPLYVPIW